jgi:TolB-like protein
VGGPNRTRVRWLAAGVTALAAAAVAIPWAMRELRESRTGNRGAISDVAEAKIPSIAVLPFANYSGDPDYFVDGMTDGVIGALGRLGGVRVISRQSAMHYKNSTKKLPEIAEELGVDYLIEGSVAREAGMVRLQARVVRPSPEQQVWAETYSQASSSVLAMHENVAVAIARAVGGGVVDRPDERRGSSRSLDPAVYEAFLQGHHFAERFDAASQRQAESHYRRALSLDPSFAPAWVGLGESLHFLSQFHVSPASLEGQAEAAVRRALQFDPESAEAFAALAEILRDRFAWTEAEAAIERAIQLDPSSAAARRRHWTLLACRLQLDEAFQEITLARRLNPLSAVISADLAVQLSFMNRHEEAIQELRRTLELDPTYSPAHAYLYLAYSELGRDDESAEELGRYLSGLGLTEMIPEYEQRLAREGFEAARRWVALSLASNDEAVTSRLGVAAGLLAQAGEVDAALRVLNLGWKRRAWELGWIAVAPDLRNLHGHPEFNRIVEQLGLPIPS